MGARLARCFKPPPRPETDEVATRGADPDSVPRASEQAASGSQQDRAGAQQNDARSEVEKHKAAHREKTAARERRSSSEHKLIRENKGGLPRKESSKIDDGLFESSSSSFSPKLNSTPSAGGDFQAHYVDDEGVETYEADAVQRA